jgi:HPr kinase/phosphorylase
VAGADQTAATAPTKAAPAQFQLHGTTVAIKIKAGALSQPSTGWVAALIRGPSGSGKSDLALRCVAQPLHNLFPAEVCSSGCRLVADDRTDIRIISGPIITAQSPAAIAGLLEVRGLGIVSVPYVAAARLILVVDLADARDVPRYPTPRATQICPEASVAHLPHILLAPFESASPLKLLLALGRTALTGGPGGADAAKHHCLPEGQ